MPDRLMRAEPLWRVLSASALDDEPFIGLLERRSSAFGGCTGFSRSWLAYTGRAPGSLAGAGWLDDVHPGDRARLQSIHEVMSAARRAYAVEFRLRRHDGRYRWVGEQALPGLAADGALRGYEHRALDVDAQVRLSESLAARCQTMRTALTHHRDVEAALADELAPETVERTRAALHAVAALGTGVGGLALARLSLHALVEDVIARLPPEPDGRTMTARLPLERIELELDLPLFAGALADALAAVPSAAARRIDAQAENGAVRLDVPAEASASALALLRFVVHLHHGSAASNDGRMQITLPVAAGA